ncbi:hypothetical protein JCM17846_04110 [Iodidimonas nitroreducens]|uniref:Uncharacterized protein n=1 Tax=Iodidimonas nitroreducens TaxID=1236968 RepID=A0A5A7N6N4_9PROT|nr:hypothetical protein JCM17846_04110 [Iodidimonas nitroreducens]
MNPPLCPGADGQGHIPSLGGQPLIDGGLLKGGFAQSDGIGNLVFQMIERRSRCPPIIGRHGAQLFHLKGYEAFFPQSLHPHGLKGIA